MLASRRLLAVPARRALVAASAPAYTKSSCRSVASVADGAGSGSHVTPFASEAAATTARGEGHQKLKARHKRAASLMLELEADFKQKVEAQEGRYEFDRFEAGDAVEVVAMNPDGRYAGKAKLLKYYGTVLGKGSSGHRVGATFSIRSVLAGVAITHTFPFHAPWVKAVSIVEKAHFKGGKKRYRHARLTKKEAELLRPFTPA